VPVVIVFELDGWDEADLTVQAAVVENQSMFSSTAISRSSMLFQGPKLRTSSALNSEFNASARALS